MAGDTGGAPQNPLSPFQKRKGDTGGWFGGWQITSMSPMRGRLYDAVFRKQALVGADGGTGGAPQLCLVPLPEKACPESTEGKGIKGMVDMTEKRMNLL